MFVKGEKAMSSRAQRTDGGLLLTCVFTRDSVCQLALGGILCLLRRSCGSWKGETLAALVLHTKRWGWLPSDRMQTKRVYCAAHLHDLALEVFVKLALIVAPA